MLITYKLNLNPIQEQALDAVLKTALYVRNKTLHLWMKSKLTSWELTGINLYHAASACTADKLNKIPNNIPTETKVLIGHRVEQSINKFNKTQDGKALRFKKNIRSIEVSPEDYLLNPEQNFLQLDIQFQISGVLKLKGKLSDLKEVNTQKKLSIVRRADGFYAEFSRQEAPWYLKKVRTPLKESVLAVEEAQLFQEGSPAAKAIVKTEKKIALIKNKISTKPTKSNRRKKLDKKLGLSQLRLYRQQKSLATNKARHACQSHDMIVVKAAPLFPVMNQQQSRARSSVVLSLFAKYLRRYEKTNDNCLFICSPSASYSASKKALASFMKRMSRFSLLDYSTGLRELYNVRDTQDSSTDKSPIKLFANCGASYDDKHPKTKKNITSKQLGSAEVNLSAKAQNGYYGGMVLDKTAIQKPSVKFNPWVGLENLGNMSLVSGSDYLEGVY